MSTVVSTPGLAAHYIEPYDDDRVAPPQTPAAPPWPVADDSHPRRWLLYPLLIAAALLYGSFLAGYHVAARPGCDQNGYLVTSRMIVEHGQLSFMPRNDWQFAGRMMVKAPSGRIYAKYPFGYPLLAALGRLIHTAQEPWGEMYAINPICTALACVMSFFLFRTVVGNFASFVGAIWMACNPVTLAFANDANSHASTLLCVVIGFWGMLRWWQLGPRGGNWRGFIGGLALGYACTIRYTEFLLILPLLFMAICRFGFRRRRIGDALVPLIGWAIPISALAISCWIAYGRPWLTGYSMCKEQTGFGWEYFLGTLSQAGVPGKQGNWETLLLQLNHIGLFLMFPLGLAGLIGLFWHSWRLGTTLLLWIVPPTVLYMFYYWAPVGEEGVGYLRFFLTVFPGTILAGLWLMDKALATHKVARALSLGALTALGCTFNVANIVPHLDNAQESSLSLMTMIHEVRSHFPPQDNVIFAEESCCEQLDNTGGYELYDLDIFRPNAFSHFKSQADVSKQDDPSGLQRSRAVEYMNLLGRQSPSGQIAARSTAEVDQEMSKLVDDAIARHKRVAMLFRNGAPWNMLGGRSDLHLKQLASWNVPAPPPPVAGGLITRWREGRDEAAKLLSQQQRKQDWVLYELVPVTK